MNNPSEGDLWLVRFKPKEDELLSSWLIRLINAHGSLVHTFCRLMWPKRVIWTKDIDLNPDEIIIDRLSTKTGVSKGEILNCTFHGYVGKFKKKLVQGNNHWILALGLYHRVRNRKSQQFCPLCLASDDKPYFRKRWRLACNVICPEHQVLLRDSCSNCGNVLTPNKMLWSSYGLPHCEKCSLSFRENSYEQIEISEELHRLHHLFEDIRLTGKVEYNGKLINGPDFMYGLQVFLSALIRKNYKRKLLKLGWKLMEKDIESDARFIDQTSIFAHMDIGMRFELMDVLAYFILMPYEKLVTTLRTNRIGSSCFWGTELSNFPSWFERFLDDINLNQASPF